MLRRVILNCLLIFFALAMDLRLPISLPISVPSVILPSCLDLLLILFCQRLRGGELVAIAGLVGLCQDFITAHPPGREVMIAATLGLIACRQQRELFCDSASDRLIRGCLWLGILVAMRLAVQAALTSFDAGGLALSMDSFRLHCTRAAATCLAFAIWQSGMSLGQLLLGATLRREETRL